LIRKVTLTLLAFLGIFIVFRQGLIPPRLSPLPAIVVERPFPWLSTGNSASLGPMTRSAAASSPANTSRARR
jgi:hypothetical protein